MGTRAICAVAIASSLFGGTAWADQQVRFEGGGLVIEIPDDWTAEGLVFKDGFELSRPGGQIVGDVEVRTDATCDEMLAAVRAMQFDAVASAAVVSAAWTSFTYRDNGRVLAYYCREIAGGIALVEGADAEMSGLAILVDNAFVRGGETSTPSTTSSGQVTLEATRLTVVVPDYWKTSVSDDGTTDVFRGKDDDRWMGELRLLEARCTTLLADSRAQLTWPTAEPSRPLRDGWAGYSYLDDEQDATYDAACRDVSIRGVAYGVVVFGHDYAVPDIVALAEDGILAYLAALPPPTTPGEPTDVHAVEPAKPKPKSKPSLRARLFPNRFELGFARLSDGPQNTLDPDYGWGATLMVERTLYDRGLPALGYRARVTPTAAGLAGFAEAEVGASVKIISVAAVAGVGGAGDNAPFGVHGGVQGEVLVPVGLGLMEAEGGYAWTTNGTVLRFEGRFVMRGGGLRAVTMGIGYERREGSAMVTIDFGTIVLPDLD